MKSLIQEASSVERAIARVWLEAGMPGEFTIKILQAGVPGILGFFGQPAVVSITFDPQKVMQAKALEKKAQAEKKRPQPQPKEVKKFEKKDTREEQRPLQRKETPVWSDDFIADIKKWLQEILDIIGIKVPFDISSDRFVLKFSFKNDLLEGVDEERMMFASLSYMLLQFLKKKYRRKFSGFRLVLTSPRSVK